MGFLPCGLLEKPTGNGVVAGGVVAGGVGWRVEQPLKKVELNRKLTPIDLLFEYGKVYHVDLGEQRMITEVPKKIRGSGGEIWVVHIP